MDYDKLNEYIRHYIEKDKSKSAIMLTGAWGIGKSYYIRNVLVPYLKSSKNGKHRCAIVSLYGLKSIAEISKNIYFELRTIWSQNKSEFFATGKAATKIVATTVLNGMISTIGFDIGSVSEGDLRNVYSSVDLSGKLIVFEDLERSTINVLDILGFVNGLVERDGVKVLLVANEDEILNNYSNESNGGAQLYIMSKEKTIGDTIVFKGNLESAIKSIINSFDNEFLNYFSEEKPTKIITKIMDSVDCYNLRLFVYACQKAVDIYELIYNRISHSKKFRENIFFGIVVFSMKKKRGEIPNWDTENNASTNLGSIEHPLYRFCYDYIKNQEIDEGTIDSNINDYNNMNKLNNISQEGLNYLSIICNFSSHTEEDVMNALREIENNITQIGYIGIRFYEKLACYLIKCNTVLGYDYTKCKERMIRFLQLTPGGNLSNFFHHEEMPIVLTNENEKKQYKKFINELDASTKKIIDEILNFKYIHSDLSKFYINISNIKDKAFLRQKFISNFNLQNLVKMIFQCCAVELDCFYQSLREVYGESSDEKLNKEDLDFMKNFKNELEKKINNTKEPFDKIKLYNIKLLISYLSQLLTPDNKY